MNRDVTQYTAEDPRRTSWSAGPVRAVWFAALTLITMAPGSAAVLELGESPCADSAETCIDLQVTCDASPGVLPTDAELRVAEPANPRAVTAFFSGGTGNVPWALEPEAEDALRTLFDGGFLTVQVVWKDGWSRGRGEGTDVLSCRTDEVLRYIRDRWQQGKLCAVGNSGGSAQIAYALARWGAAPMLDLAVLGSGPPLARVDLGCDPSSPYWYGTETVIVDGSLGCHQSMEDCPCETNDPAFASRFFDMGVVSPLSTYVYPGTEVVLLTGLLDRGPSVLHADLFEDRLQASSRAYRRAWLGAADHMIQASPEGAREVLVTLWSRCR